MGSDTGVRRGRQTLVANAGVIQPVGNVIYMKPIEDNSKHTPSIEEDLLLAISVQAIQDLDEIFLLDTTHPDVERKQELLSNWWGARAYVQSDIFEEDCKLAGIDVDVAREKLADKIKRGRACYGRWVRTVPTINLPVEDKDGPDEI